MGLKDHVIVGTERTVVAVIGNDRFKDRSALESVEGVEKVVPILAPYKMASREIQKGAIGGPVALGQESAAVPKIGGKKIAVIAGSVQRREQDADAGNGACGERGGGGGACAAERSSRAPILIHFRGWPRRG